MNGDVTTMITIRAAEHAGDVNGFIYCNAWYCVLAVIFIVLFCCCLSVIADIIYTCLCFVIDKIKRSKHERRRE